MSIELPAPPSEAHVQPRSPHASETRSLYARLTAGGTAGNERLTTVTGIVLIVLLVAIGVTILRLGPLLWEHLFIGMLLIGPVALKLASTGYRFARYYTANPRYRRKGPPPAPLRMLAPIVAVSTVAVLATGVLLLLEGPDSRATLLPLHKLSFIAWIAATGLHVLGHLPEVAVALGFDREVVSKTDVLAAVGARAGETADIETNGIDAWEALGTRTAREGRAGRGTALAAALAAGTALAIVTIPQFGPWLHASRYLHH
jgi:hypothetical protein